MAEDPESWGEAEHVVYDAINATSLDRARGIFGLSMSKRITNALRSAGLLVPSCRYEDVWTDEVGEIPVCVVHGNNSRHIDSDDPHRPCLTVDPYPAEPHTYAIEVLVNPGSSRAYWRIDTEWDPTSDLEVARRYYTQAVHEGYHPAQVRVVAVTVVT